MCDRQRERERERKVGYGNECLSVLEREPGRVRVGLPAFVVASATERERDASVGSFFPALSFPKLINCKQA